MKPPSIPLQSVTHYTNSMPQRDNRRSLLPQNNPSLTHSVSQGFWSFLRYLVMHHFELFSPDSDTWALGIG